MSFLRGAEITRKLKRIILGATTALAITLLPPMPALAHGPGPGFGHPRGLGCGLVGAYPHR